MKTDIESLVMMLEDIKKRVTKLNDWEAGFIQSVEKQIDKGQLLSAKQDQRFTEIWERVTDI